MEHTGDGAALRTITDLRQTKQGRIAVFFDGEFDFSVDDETLVQYHQRRKNRTGTECLGK